MLANLLADEDPMASDTPVIKNDAESTDTVTASEALPDNADDARLKDIYRRISRGDTSVVSDVYWLQLLD
jgi:hypothetical protein